MGFPNFKLGATLVAAATLVGMTSSAWSSDFSLMQEYLSGEKPFTDAEAVYAGDPITLRFSSSLPTQSAVMPVFQKAANLLAAKTNGKIVVQQYHGGVLHGFADGFDAVRGGISDMAACFIQAQPNMPISNGWYLPFVAPGNHSHATRVAARLAPKYMKPEYDAAGVYLGGIMQTGSFNLVSNQPVRTAEDFRGLRVGVTAQSLAPYMAALGAAPVQLGFGDVYTALQRKTVDAVLWVDVALLAYKTFEVSTHWTHIDMSSGTIDTCISQQWYDNLPADLKPVFAKWVQLLHQATSQLGVMNVVDFNRYGENGVEMIEMAEEERAKMREAFQPLIDKWAETAGQAGLNTEEFFADIETMRAELDGKTPNEITQLTVEKPVEGILP